MPRIAKAKAKPIGSTTLVLDNGGYNIKAGLVSSSQASESDCKVVPNCIARDRTRRTWIAGQLSKCRDFGEMSFRRPVEKGYVVNWEIEREIWEETFFDKHAELMCDPHDTNLILTEAPNAPQVLQSNCDQMIFEEYEFASYFRCIAPSLVSYNNMRTLQGADDQNVGNVIPAQCVLVVDSGYSHTTVTPLYRGKPIQSAIRRLEIGGRFLTNYLKELVSIRSYNMMDETYTIDKMKEDISFVSDNFNEDLERTWKSGKGDERAAAISTDWNEMTCQADILVETGRRGIVVDYVLPDYDKLKAGYIRPHDPIQAKKLQKLALSGKGQETEAFITVGNERFVVPELLFNPGDIGMKQAGIPELITESLEHLPEGIRPAMLANIIVVGGNANIEGFVERLKGELRQSIPDGYPLRISKSQDAAKTIWNGGANLANNLEALKTVLVTRQDYQEYGGAWLSRKFAGNTGP